MKTPIAGIAENCQKVQIEQPESPVSEIFNFQSLAILAILDFISLPTIEKIWFPIETIPPSPAHT